MNAFKDSLFGKDDYMDMNLNKTSNSILIILIVYESKRREEWTLYNFEICPFMALSGCQLTLHDTIITYLIFSGALPFSAISLPAMPAKRK